MTIVAATTKTTTQTKSAVTAKAIAAAPLPPAPVLDPITTITQPVDILHAGTGTILTVGTGMEFATLNDALKASVDGDTIAVRAGTYVNDFCTINTDVTIVAMGGVVNEVATVPPPNDKGLFLVNADATIQGFTFTGGSDGSPDGNVSGIRYQAGNLTVEYCYFHDMQEGLMGAPTTQGSGSITIDHSEFSNNGTGDGYTHDIYVGDVGSFTLTNSYIHNAIVGHEVKSRAGVTTITNNIIADGPTGTASYDIDLPNAGVATVSGNVIEKGPDASNTFAIHYGGETQLSWANNSLSVTGNTFLNDYGPDASAVDNSSQVNGLNVSVSLDGNSFYGFSQQQLVTGGPGTATNSTFLTTEPGYSTQSPWAVPPAVQIASGPQLLDLTTSCHTVTGGAAQLIVSDTAGDNTITGGAGGLVANVSGDWDLITTQPGRSSTVDVGGRNNIVHSGGLDSITMDSTYGEVDATGRSTIAGASFATYNLSGNETATLTGGGSLNLAAAARVNAAIESGVNGTKAATGLDWLTGAPGDPAAASATIGGGAATFYATGTTLDLTYTSGAGQATLGGGTFSVTGGSGNDSFVTGTGNATLMLGTGMDSVVFGAGSTAVTAGAGADTYVFKAAQAGNASITGFKQGQDALAYVGFAGKAIASGVIAGGSTILTLTNGAQITLVDVVVRGYPTAPGGSGAPPAPAPGGGDSGGGSSPGSSGIGSSGGTLTTHGNLVTGGAGLFTITDLAGGNTIAGGSGGLLTTPLGGDSVTTAAGSQNQISLADHCTLAGAGADQVSVSSYYNSIQEAAASTVTLALFGNTVQGGAGLLTVNDSAGGNQILGGAGGVALSALPGSETITTQAGASDTIAAGGYSTLNLAGDDAVTLSGLYSAVTASGHDTITSASGWSGFDLEGQDTLQGTGAGVVTIGQHAQATLLSSGAGGSPITKLAGGSLVLQQAIQRDDDQAVEDNR